MTNPAHEPITGYDLTARLFHWLTAILVLVQIPLGILVANFDLGALYNLHKSNGVLILVVVICRLLWRMTHQPPPLSSDIPAIQRLAAHSVHWALYALLILQPIVGWIATSAYPAPVPFFGLFELPSIWGADRALSEQLFVVHLGLRHCHGRPDGRAYRSGAVSSFRSQGRGARSHDPRLRIAPLPEIRRG